MLGVTSYRDYFSNGLKAKQKTLKTESLFQYVYDMSEIFGKDVEVIPSMDVFDLDISKYSGLILFDHPTSLISQGKLTGFTTANLHTHAQTLKLLSEFDGPKYLISDKADEIPSWIERYGNRILKPSTAQNKSVIWPSHEMVAGTIESFQNITDDFHQIRNRPRRTFGDSHATMFWAPHRTCFTTFGLTLYRALSNTLENLVGTYLDEAVFCFGNIDLRYHLARQKNAKNATEELACEYVKQAARTAKKVKIASLLPVTGEISGIIKAYLYKKEQYFGSFEERQELRTLFNSCLKDEAKQTKNVTILEVPEVLIDERGMMNEKCRERRGVHVSPAFYERCLSCGCEEARPEFHWPEVHY